MYMLGIRSRSTAVALVAAAAPAFAQNIGPSTTVNPYVLPTRPGVATTSILTVGDAVGSYKMVGIPDGLGAFDGPNGKLTLLMNHELGGTVGSVRAHGYAGAFVSRWEIEKGTLKVTSGRDHNASPGDVVWSSQAPRALSRFCSADLAPASAYRFGSLGTDARIQLTGEESGAEGTAWAHIATGPEANASFELPALGRISWENAVANPATQEKTIVVGLDDSTPGQVYVYIGTKTASGNECTRAGLTNGTLYGVRVPGVTTEARATPINGAFNLANLGSQYGVTGAALETASNAASVTRFNRPEDGAWDARVGRENDFYFVTTDALTVSGGRSRLYRLRFTSIAAPELGGTIACLLDGTEGHEMADNMCIDSLGRILIQEDVGGNARLGAIWLYDTSTGSLGMVARHDPAYFQSGGTKFLTIDEESSGIVDAAPLLGAGWFLLDVQAHYSIPGELVEGGQLLALYVDPKLRYPAGVEPIGRSSAGCEGPLTIGTTMPTVGNAGFELSCQKAPPTGIGSVYFAAAALTTPITFWGLELYANPGVQPFLVVPASVDATGSSTVVAPLPPQLLPGSLLVSQFIWFGPTGPPPCPIYGLSATPGVKITVQS